MMYIESVFVDIAEISFISSIICGLYPFWNGTSFEFFTLSPTLNFSFKYLLLVLLYRIERKSVFLPSLGEFPIDHLTRQLIVDTN